MNARVFADNLATISEIQRRLNQRGETLDIDGHGGSFTRAALDRRLPNLDARTPIGPPAAPPPSVASASQRHYALAKQYVGLKEQAGPGTHPLLVPMFDLAPDWLDQDDSKTAWCGILRGWIGHKCGTGLPAEHYRAAAWARWGSAVPVDKPAVWRQGDTIIMTRPGGNHVALLDRVTASYVFVLGGNQNNEVNITRYSLSRVTAVRR